MTSRKPRVGRKAIVIPQMTPKDIERFWGHVTKRAPDECWPWTGALSGDGYGRFKIARRLYSPHRVAHQLAAGRIGKRQANLLVLHSCHNPACCNPAHLRLGSGSQNNMDAIEAGRWEPVTANLPNAKVQ